MAALRSVVEGCSVLSGSKPVILVGDETVDDWCDSDDDG